MKCEKKRGGGRTKTEFRWMIHTLLDRGLQLPTINNSIRVEIEGKHVR
jgi:hypothetical protein